MVKIEKQSITSEVRQIYQQKCDDVIGDKSNVLVSHFGAFSQELVTSLSQGIEDLLISIGDDRMVIKRIFSILIEGLQNIRIHGEREESHNRQLAYLILADDKKTYRIVLANLMKSEDISKVKGFIDKINGYSKSDLKETYLSILSNEFLSQKGGAGLGFITTRMKSDFPLGFTISDLSNGMCLFSLELRLNRGKKK
ncbi:MAG: SiaB family protein kinase [Crocinitomicaceae bacterium]|nr:SiaB family protein kinase [Crocinitomicaceae bacterium]